MQTVALAKKLIRYQTVSGNDVEQSSCIEFCQNYLKEAGLRTSVLSNHGKKALICNLKNYSTDFLLTGHLDVVEGQPEQFFPKVKGDRLFGRGAVDMKAGCAIAMNVLRALAEHEQQQNVGLVLTMDEELGGQHGMGFLTGQGLKAKMAVALEPGQNGITIKQKGVLWARLTAKGIPGHASKPWLGDNAAIKLMNGIKKGLLLAKQPRREQWVNTVNLGFLQSGQSANRIPEKGEAILDYRLISNESRDSIKKSLSKIKEVTFETVAESPVMSTDRNNRLVKAFQKRVSQIYGKKIPFVYGHGASDLRWLTNKGIPSVVFGPYGENYHGNDEWVSIADIKRVEDSYLRFSQQF